MVVSYEAFAVKMLGAMRQEIIFARHMKEAGRQVRWWGVPIVLTSHTWENGKNEQSHQDPTLAEAWLGEMADVAPVYFPFDANTSVMVLERVYQHTGQVAAVVAAKSVLPQYCHIDLARQAVRDGAYVISHDDDAKVQLLAIGAYQLLAAIQAADILRARNIACSVVAIIEPGRFRIARDTMEKTHVHDDVAITRIIPAVTKRIFVCHTRAEVMAGVLRRLDTGVANTTFIGYANHGGTLDVNGMLLVNGQTGLQIAEHVLKWPSLP